MGSKDMLGIPRLKNGPVRFYARMGGTGVNPLTYDTVVTDSHSIAFNAANTTVKDGLLVPMDGLYHVDVNLVANCSGSNFYDLVLYVVNQHTGSGQAVAQDRADNGFNRNMGTHITLTLELNRGDRLSVNATASGAVSFSTGSISLCLIAPL